jgi:hypothetical protein
VILWYSSEKENSKLITLLFHTLTSIVIHNNLLISSPIVWLKSCSVLYTHVILLGPCSLCYNPSVFSFTFLSYFFLLFLDVFIVTSSNSIVLIILIKISCTKHKRFPFSGLVQDIISSRLTFSYCGRVTLTF